MSENVIRVIYFGGWGLMLVASLVWTSLRLHIHGDIGEPPPVVLALVLGGLWPIFVAAAFLWFCILRPGHLLIGAIVADLPKARQSAVEMQEREADAALAAALEAVRPYVPNVIDRALKPEATDAD